MYRFARTPLWLAGHLLAGGLMMIFLIAGFWQLSRHGEQRDRNAVAAERQELRPLDADRFFEAVSDAETIGQLEYRSVTFPAIRFDWGDRVLIRNRTLNGIAGCHLALPAENVSVSGDVTVGTGVLVVAGWLNAGVCDPAAARRAAFERGLAETGQIAGRVRLSQQRGLLGPTDPSDGRLESLARTDVQRINQQTSLELAPVYVELITAARVDGAPIKLGDNASGTGLSALLVPLPSPELDAGPHLGYALQWFGFAAVAIVGYTLVLRHQARKGESEQIADD